MNIFFVLAAGLATFNTCLHFFLGGKTIAQPLLEATSISKRVRYVQYFCWHIATLTLLLQVILFGISAMAPNQISLAIVGTVLAAALGMLGISIPLFMKIGYKTMPQGWLFVPVTLLGLAGLIL